MKNFLYGFVFVFLAAVIVSAGGPPIFTGAGGTLTGGGILATGGFTLTVPATGTAALLGTANAFTAANTFAAGGGSGTFKSTGLLNSQINVLNNGAGQTENDMHTFSIPASTFNANGQVIRYHAYGTFANTANVQTVKIYFGGTLCGTITATAALSGQWDANLTVSRTGASTQWASFTATCDLTNTTSTTVTTGQTLAITDTNAIIIKTTGQETASGTGVTENGFHIYFDNF